MNTQSFRHLDALIARYPALAPSRDAIAQAYEILASSYEAGGQLLIAGNGGSAADAEHIVGELMKGFLSKRPMDEAGKKAFREALVVPRALVKQIFAYQLDQRKPDDAKRHDDDQQVGDGNLPAYGMYKGFNPCQ